ncbi:MAG: multicopper oxidase domain-containing protein [Pseudomonadota bacterium]
MRSFIIHISKILGSTFLASGLFGAAFATDSAFTPSGELANPPEMQKSDDGVYQLTAGVDVYSLAEDTNVLSRAFVQEGATRLVGPTMRITPGDDIKLDFVNDLPFLPAAAGDELMITMGHGGHGGNASMSGDEMRALANVIDTVPHGFDIMNIHYHGMHVPPQSPGDNVLLNVYPSSSDPALIAECEAAISDDVAHKHICVHGEFNYQMKVPETHPAGSYWYHPHKHGAVAMHLGSGMSGFLLVEDQTNGIDSLAAVKNAKSAIGEKLLVLAQPSFRTQNVELNGTAATPEELQANYVNGTQTVTPTLADIDDGDIYPVDCMGTYYFLAPCSYEPLATATLNKAVGNSLTPNVNNRFTVNGMLDAKITINTGEVQFWRMLNASVGSTVPVCFAPISDAGSTQATAEDISIYVLAVDGVPVEQPKATTGTVPFELKAPVYDLAASSQPAVDVVNNEMALLTAGQRLDLMVEAPSSPGLYALVQPQDSTAMDALCDAPTSADDVVVYVNVVEGTARNTDIPTQLELNALQRPASVVAASDAPKSPTQTVFFGFSQSGDPRYPISGASYVNGQVFSTTEVQRMIMLDQADYWNVWSNNDTHMYHIHTNPFQIFSRGGVDYDFPVWRDTALINCEPRQFCSFTGGLTKAIKEGGAQEVVEFMSRAVDFTGAMVLHCHNVDHEDNGMMQLLEIAEAAN